MKNNPLEMYDCGTEAISFILRPDTFAWKVKAEDGKFYGDYITINGFSDTPEEVFPLLLAQARMAINEVKANRALAEFLTRMETKRKHIQKIKIMREQEEDYEKELEASEKK